jgi:hypothetical protein
LELGSFPNPGYDNLNIYVYTNDVNNQPDTISGDIFIKPMPFAVPGPKPFGSTYGSSFDNLAQPVTKTQVPAFSIFPYSSSSGPITVPVVRLPSPSGGM